MKLKHKNSTLEYFEYFCQISSKSIPIIMSYTVSETQHSADVLENLTDGLRWAVVSRS